MRRPACWLPKWIQFWRPRDTPLWQGFLDGLPGEPSIDYSPSESTTATIRNRNAGADLRVDFGSFLIVAELRCCFSRLENPAKGGIVEGQERLKRVPSFCFLDSSPPVSTAGK